MKLVRIATTKGPVIGIAHDLGRIERILVSDYIEVKPELVERLVNCFNACDGLTDSTMQRMAAGETGAGSLLERTVAWSLFFSNNPRLAREWLEKARAEIDKLTTGGPST
jgi:hypothetical protein